MPHVERQNRLAVDLKFLERLNFNQIQLWFAAAFLGFFENIAEPLADFFEREGRAVEFDMTLHHEIDLPQFVNAADMIVVAVRNQNAVNPVELMRQRLQAEIRPRVDQQLDAAVRDDIGARAKARVAWIMRRAGRAVAA